MLFGIQFDVMIRDAQASNAQINLENYTFKITASSPKGQWV